MTILTSTRMMSFYYRSHTCHRLNNQAKIINIRRNNQSDKVVTLHHDKEIKGNCNSNSISSNSKSGMGLFL